MLYSMPDRMYAPLTNVQYDEIAAALPKEIEANYQLYLESLKRPMPFYIGVPKIGWHEACAELGCVL